MRISDWSSDVCSSDLHTTSDGGKASLHAADFRSVPFGMRVGTTAPSPHPRHSTPASRGRRIYRRFPAHRSGDHCISRSEEHTSELQSLMRISYAVFCMKKK